MRPAPVAGLVAALGLALAACTTSSPEDQEPPAAAAPPPPAAESAPPPDEGPVGPAPQSRPGDACGASALQGLIGHPRTEIPVPLEPNRQRVACTTCPVTQDYRPDRLNFFFDAETGRIKEIRCG